MSPQQLLLRDRRDGGSDVEAVDNPGNVRPVDFEDAASGVHIPHLGSQDLLRLASALTTSGYLLREIDIRDSSFQEVDDEEVRSLEEMAIELLRKGQTLEAIELFQQTNRRLFVLGIALSEPDGPRRVSIARDGVLFVNPPTGAQRVSEALIGRLQGFWSKVGLT